jgi:hypothetical protein
MKSFSAEASSACISKEDLMDAPKHHPSQTPQQDSDGPRIFQLDKDTVGVGAIQTLNNIVSMTSVSK